MNGSKSYSLQDFLQLDMSQSVCLCKDFRAEVDGVVRLEYGLIKRMHIWVYLVPIFVSKFSNSPH